MRYLTWRRKPWVFFGEIPGLRQQGGLTRFIRYQLQGPIKGGAVAIAATGSLAVVAYQKLFPEIPVFNIPYFCDLAPFRAAARQRRKENGPPVSILFSGQSIERKGIDVLIHAFALIAHRAPALELHLLGTDQALDSMCKLPTNLSDRIHFLGFKQPAELPPIFAAADIFVLPSRHDGWGVVVNEALGAGLPIIVSDRVGARDLVDHGRNGLITCAGDVEALADALLQLGQSHDMRRSFAAASTERAAKWDLDEGVRRWIELYDRAVTGRPK
jgi:glycosyltransferase involved in cell wall biosynthesis